ncbi:MAG: GAF domain-containing sensor histidine kinase [Candidatus Dormiibacterota bacterium]
MTERRETIEADLVSRGDPHEIMRRLVTLAARTADADRCTLTSIDQHVFRVEASFEVGGPPDFVGREYPLTWLSRQPLLEEAVTSGAIVIGGGFGEGGEVDTAIAPALLNVVHTGTVPLTIGDSVGAVLILSRKRDIPFVARDLEGLQQFAVLAVLALRNARLIDEVRSAQQRGLEALTMMSRHVAMSVESAAFLERMSETIAALAHAERAAFWQLTGNELVVLNGWRGGGLPSTAALRLPVPNPDDRLSLAPALYEGTALRITAGQTEAGSHLATALSMMAARDLLVVPWRTAAGPLGLLMACNSDSGFIEEDEWIMRLAARASALVWQGYEAENRVEQLQTAEVRRLEAHAARMAELDQQKSEFLQLASHELRSPITLVSGYLSMLEDGSLGHLPEPAAKVVPLMSARMRQMAQLVERMLSASRMEVRRRGTPVVDVRLDDIARAVVASHTMDDDGRRVNVRAAGPLYVRADPESVETMLNNLVSNALKYSAASSDIAVVVREEPGWAVVDVVDQGIGISRREMAKLFQPFGRLDSALSAGIEGTGLGLHLSRNLALSFGGDIDVQSRPGKGSTFTLRLPVRPSDPTSVAEN